MLSMLLAGAAFGASIDVCGYKTNSGSWHRMTCQGSTSTVAYGWKSYNGHWLRTDAHSNSWWRGVMDYLPTLCPDTSGAAGSCYRY